RDPLDTLPTRLDALAEDGAPNYFGEQRFGRDGQNVEIAQRLFAGARVPRRERSIGLSAARSFLFNEILANRVAAGRWGALIPGDVANLDGRNSVFAVDVVDVELERRCRALDIHPTGPLWGRGGPGSAGDAAALETSLVAGYPALVAGLEAMTELMRRPLRMRVESLQWHRQEDTVTLAFDLRRGSFATAVLRELVSAPASR
ncbi:MAG: tRNA pseudouridine(13) synthase TruD, partial [Pseudomonadota bacterium]